MCEYFSKTENQFSQIMKQAANEAFEFYDLVGPVFSQLNENLITNQDPHRQIEND